MSSANSAAPEPAPYAPTGCCRDRAASSDRRSTSASRASLCFLDASLLRMPATSTSVIDPAGAEAEVADEGFAPDAGAVGAAPAALAFPKIDDMIFPKTLMVSSYVSLLGIAVGIFHIQRLELRAMERSIRFLHSPLHSRSRPPAVLSASQKPSSVPILVTVSSGSAATRAARERSRREEGEEIAPSLTQGETRKRADAFSVQSQLPEQASRFASPTSRYRSRREFILDRHGNQDHRCSGMGILFRRAFVDQL